MRIAMSGFDQMRRPIWISKWHFLARSDDISEPKRVLHLIAAHGYKVIAGTPGEAWPHSKKGYCRRGCFAKRRYEDATELADRSGQNTQIRIPPSAGLRRWLPEFDFHDFHFVLTGLGRSRN